MGGLARCNVTLKKVGEIRYESSIKNLIRVLTSPDDLLPGIPFVVGLSGKRIRLLFRRLLFRFQDDYEINSEQLEEDEVKLIFKGEKSTIIILFKIYPRLIQVFADYSGPRKWVVWPRVKDLALSIASFAVEHAGHVEQKEEEVKEDYSKMLADLSWITRLLMKSMLVKTMDVVIRRGEFNKFIEDLHNLGVFKNYKMIYVSGSGNGSFRLLFINGELVGVYSIVEGDEILGDTTKLNKLEGYYKVKIYGSITPTLEVKQ